MNVGLINSDSTSSSNNPNKIFPFDRFSISSNLYFFPKSRRKPLSSNEIGSIERFFEMV